MARFAFLAVFLLIFFVYAPLIALVVLQYVANWKILRKMGHGGWWIFVPFATLFIYYDKCWKRGAFWRYIAYYVIYIVGYFIYMFYTMFSAFTSAAGNVNNMMTAMLLFFVFMLIMLIPMLVSLIRMYRRVAVCFGKSKGFGWGLALLGPIFTMILGFGDAQYLGNLSDPMLQYAPPQN